MKLRPRSRAILLSVTAVTLVASGLYLVLRSRQSSYLEPVGRNGFYYTGPVESKNHPGLFVMPDGRVVPRPANWPRPVSGGSVGKRGDD